MGDFIFFSGLLAENFLFSFALGHKDRLEAEEKENYHINLISQLKKNKILEEENLRAENEKIRIEQENTDLALAVLRNQINPHFIFNTLHSIKIYIMANDRENAVIYLTKFSKLIRLILNSSIEKESTLDAEIEILKLYFDIENIRFGGEMIFDIKTNPKIRTEYITVPPLFLQPFLENAIWHGIAASDEKKINLTVDETDDNLIKIILNDTGIGVKKCAENIVKEEYKRKSYGTSIVKDSLAKFYKNQFSINYSDYRNEMGKTPGTTVTIIIPKQKNY